jgi:hypothetical protein
MKYGLYQMLYALALTRFPNWARMYESQELVNNSRWINGVLTGRLLFIRLSGRISKMSKGLPEKTQYFQSLSLSALSDLTTLNAVSPTSSVKAHALSSCLEFENHLFPLFCTMGSKSDSSSAGYIATRNGHERSYLSQLAFDSRTGICSFSANAHWNLRQTMHLI